MKKNFAEPEMEVVRFNAQEIVTATSGGCIDGFCGDDTPLGPAPCTEFIQGDDNW